MIPLSGLSAILREYGPAKEGSAPDGLATSSATLSEKRDLHTLLRDHIESLLSSYPVELSEAEVRTALVDIPQWRVDTVLAKLRSLVEKAARRSVGEYCRSLESNRKRDLEQALHRQGRYDFRKNIHTDLYVGLHTAISANFKMLGLSQSVACKDTASLRELSEPLFTALRIVASFPLRMLMRLDGLFWDSGHYSIPKEFEYHRGEWHILESALRARLAAISFDEKQTGCPALKAKLDSGQLGMDYIEEFCFQTVEQFAPRDSFESGE